MDGTHHLDPEIPASAVIPVNPRVELVEGDIHGANAVLHKQLTRLPLYFSIRVRARQTGQSASREQYLLKYEYSRQKYVFTLNLRRLRFEALPRQCRSTINRCPVLGPKGC